MLNEAECCFEAEVVGGVQLVGAPLLGHTHGVQHGLRPHRVRRVPDVVQRPVRGVPPVIAGDTQSISRAVIVMFSYSS